MRKRSLQTFYRIMNYKKNKEIIRLGLYEIIILRRKKERKKERKKTKKKKGKTGKESKTENKR